MANLEENDGLTPLEKCQFFDFLNFLFLLPRKAFFVQECNKTHISGLHCLKKKKNGKMANFCAKQWVNPFGKMSIFRLFELLMFIA